MAINLASKFEKKTSELLKARRKTESVVNNDFSWDGVNAINVYTLTDPTMGSYDPNGGSARYGNPTEVEDTIQTWTLSRDRAWTKTIDKLNYQDTQEVRKAGKYLAQATKNVLVPEMDTYIIQTIVTAGEVANRDDIATDAATTASNAYTDFTLITADISNQEAPEDGRVALMTPSYYNFLKSSGFVLDSDSAYKDRKSGDYGSVDGCKVVIVPSSRMPANTNLVITHPIVTVAPEKLVDYTLHDNPPGVSGQLLEYRHRYDAFVDTNKTGCIGIHKTAQYTMNIFISQYRTQPHRVLVRVNGQTMLQLANNKGYALIDDDYKHLNAYKWCLAGDGYAVSWVDGKLQKLHHLIIGKPTKGNVADHINRNKLDNRKSNLRLTTQKVNMRNTGMFSTNTSGYRGVTYDKQNKKWIAQAFFDGRLRFGGRYNNIKDAVNARKKLETQYAIEGV